MEAEKQQKSQKPADDIPSVDIRIIDPDGAQVDIAIDGNTQVLQAQPGYQFNLYGVSQKNAAFIPSDNDLIIKLADGGEVKLLSFFTNRANSSCPAEFKFYSRSISQANDPNAEVLNEDGELTEATKVEELDVDLLIETTEANQDLDDLLEPEPIPIVVSNTSTQSIEIAEAQPMHDHEYHGEPSVFTIHEAFADEASGKLLFRVTREGDINSTATIGFRTEDLPPDPIDLPAFAGLDYVATSGQLVFAPGVTEQTITVTLLPDQLDEPKELIAVIIESLDDSVIVKPKAKGEIFDGDPLLPRISILDAATAENNGFMDFTLELSQASADVITVEVYFSDGSATEGPDYTFPSSPGMNIVTFNPGETTATFSISLNDDALPEGDEFFRLHLGKAVNGVIDDGQAIGTIIDDDTGPLNTHPLSILGRQEIRIDFNKLEELKEQEMSTGKTLPKEDLKGLLQDVFDNDKTIFKEETPGKIQTTESNTASLSTEHQGMMEADSTVEMKFDELATVEGDVII